MVPDDRREDILRDLNLEPTSQCRRSEDGLRVISLPIFEEEVALSLKSAEEAWRRLTPAQQQIAYHRLVGKKTWKTIAETLSRRDEFEIVHPEDVRLAYCCVCDAIRDAAVVRH